MPNLVVLGKMVWGRKWAVGPRKKIGSELALASLAAERGWSHTPFHLVCGLL